MILNQLQNHLPSQLPAACRFFIIKEQGQETVKRQSKDDAHGHHNDIHVATDMTRILTIFLRLLTQIRHSE
jgi:hypothetical protein